MPSNVKNEDISKWEIALAVVAIFASVGAILICSEPPIHYFWLKLAGFAGVAVICILCSRHKLGVVLAIAGFIGLRLIIWALISLLKLM
jgi:hypothetical protein